MDNVESWLLLKSIKGIGNRLLYKAFRHFGSVDSILQADKSSLESILGSKAKNILTKDFDTENIKNTLKTLRLLNLEAISYEDKHYPKSLFLLPDPPPVIFIKGNKNLLGMDAVSMVGSRKPSLDAINMVNGVMSHMRVPIISGGADGIDFAVHKTAMKRHLSTVVVLGFGFLYAKSPLFNEVLDKNGLLMTEFLPHEKPSKFTFPQRNRIIASMGNYLIVFQASSKSGALITAYWAFKLNKKVFAYIGTPPAEFEGCSLLIRENVARLFISKTQILSDLKINVDEMPNHPILSYLDSPCKFEELMVKTGIDEEKLTLELTMLEIEGIIRKEGAYFVKNA